MRECKIRPQHPATMLKLRLPDAIHVAAAARAGCDLLLSNDKRMKVPEGMTLLPLA